MIDNRFYVYVYKSPEGIPFYVGKGCGKRHLSHIKEARNNNETLKQQYINNILNQGKYPIIEKIIEDVDEEFAFLVEQEYIEKYGRIDLGSGCLTNRTSGGDGWCVWDDLSTEDKQNRIVGLINYTKHIRVVDDEYKNKISIGLKFYHKHNEVSQETRDKISKSNSGENNGMFGKNHTEEIKEYLRRINTGKTILQETRDKISIALTGTRIGEDNPFYGWVHTEETLKKIGESSKKVADDYIENHGRHWNSGRKASKETLEKLSKKSVCPYCGKFGGGSAMNRYHFDNCKTKDNK